MTLRKSKKKNTLDCTIDAIGEYIRANHLQEGSPLPTEIELSQQLGVSRTILREALQHFRTLGIITAKSKTGSRLNRLFPDNPFQSYQPFLLTQPGISQKLIEFRGILETGMAEFIVRNATPARIKAMRSHNEKMAKTEDFAKRTMEDSLFHAELLRILQNPFIDSLIPLFIDFFQQTLAIDEKLFPTKREDVDREHGRIIECIVTKNTDGLREILRRHNEANVDFASKMFP